MDLSKGSSSNSPCNLTIAPERFYLVGVGAIPYSPATFFRTHFLRFILIAKSTANFNKLEKLTQLIDKKSFDYKVKADKNKVRSKIFLFFDHTFLKKKGRSLPAFIYFNYYKISFAFATTLSTVKPKSLNN